MHLSKNSRSIAIIIVTLLAGHCALAQTNSSKTLPQKAVRRQNVAVSAASGESWLAHLNRSFDETSMGKTGHLGPRAPAPGETASPSQPDLASNVASQTLTLHGSDLYRLNCQGCHGESGQGAQPEINSVINPVRATSVTLVMKRMKTAGMDIGRADAAKLARESKSALLLRLHNGGQDMPPFPHLNEAEIRSLFAYLKQLAGVPGAEVDQVAVNESPTRVGEHIVKSTCYICHSAAGPDPDAQQLWDGAIPPLSVLTTRKSLPQFIQKVTLGAPILMGAQPMLYRGRMPVFYYLSKEEAADVYLYLTRYPPSESAGPDTAIALSQQRPAGNGGTPPAHKPLNPSVVRNDEPPEVRQPNRPTDLHAGVLLTAVASSVILLLAGGLGFTVREFRRLSAGKTSVLPNCENKTCREDEDVTATLQRVS
jgi:mono/diheme cytochrome c family protein